MLLPLLEDIETFGFSGSLPADRKGDSSWQFRFKDRDGKSYGVDVKVDPSKTPWHTDFSLSSVSVPGELISRYLPKDWAVLSSTGECRLLKTNLAGPWGKWKDWKSDIHAVVDSEDCYIPAIDYRLRGGHLDINIGGEGFAWEGTAALTAEEIWVPGLSLPLVGLRARDLAVSASLEDSMFSLNGPWTMKDAVGSSFSGLLKVSPKGNFVLSGNTTKFNWEGLGLNPGGVWKATFESRGQVKGEAATQVELDLVGKGCKWGQYDLSKRPVAVKMNADLSPGRPPQLKDVELSWGKAFEVQFSDCDWSGEKFRAGKAKLSGDLLVLGEFLPDFSPNPRFGRWVHPRDWQITGGVEIQVVPHVAINIQEGHIDSGKGFKGPISFGYSAGTRNWSFRSPTLELSLREIASEVGIDTKYVQGKVTIKGDLEGQVPKRGSAEGWIRTANIDGRISECKVLIERPTKLQPRNAYWAAGEDINGTFQLNWSPQTSRLETNLSAGRWFWFTKPPMVTPNPEWKKTLEAPYQLYLLASSNRGGIYEVEDCSLTMGGSRPIILDLKGSIEQKPGGQLRPDLRVRVEGNRAGLTPVFRGLKFSGTGDFNGKITGNEFGNWIVNGKASLSGLSVRHIGVPMFLQNIEGEFPVRDTPMDEMFSPDRWKRRPHPLPPAPDQSDSLTRMFKDSKGSKENITIEEAWVGRSHYKDLSLRTLLHKEVLHMNTIQGRFAEGGHKVWMTGFARTVPGESPEWRLRGLTKDIPISLGLPDFFEHWVEMKAAKVDFYLTRTVPDPVEEWRFITLEVPVGRLIDIPGIGELFDLFREGSETTFAVKRVGRERWQVLNPFSLEDTWQIPWSIPKGLYQGGENMLYDIKDGAIDGILDFIEGGK